MRAVQIISGLACTFLFLALALYRAQLGSVGAALAIHVFGVIRLTASATQNGLTAGMSFATLRDFGAWPAQFLAAGFAGREIA